MAKTISISVTKFQVAWALHVFFTSFALMDWANIVSMKLLAMVVIIRLVVSRVIYTLM